MIRKKEDHYYYHHKCSCDIREVEVAPCMGAERNTNASNDNPLIVKVRRRIKKATFNRPRNEVFVEDDVAQCLVASPNMSPLNNRIVCIESKKTQKATKTRDVIPLNSMVICKDGGNRDRHPFGVGEELDPIPTITVAHHHAVAVIRRQK